MARKIVDAHHHLWDLNHCHYPWLMAKGVRRFFGDPTPIQQNYLPDNFVHDAADYEIVGSVHIQVGTAIEDSVKETQWLQSLGEQPRHLPSAIVGFADLSAAELADTLDAHQSCSRFCGVRQIIGRHPSEDAQTGTGDLLDNPAFLLGLNTLSVRSLNFDLQLIEGQYEKAATLLADVPDLPVAICHFASPWDLSKEGFVRWQAAMQHFAKLPNAHMKFSGFGMFKPDWTVDDVRPWMEAALDLFGPDRCMAGTNFPVDKLYGRYDRIWTACETIIGEGAALDKVTRTNALQFYRMA